MFTSLFFFGCKETLYEENLEVITDETGVVISIPAIWERDITEKSKTYIAGTLIPIFHKHMVIVPGRSRQNLAMLVALDATTAEEVWRWSDDIEGYHFTKFRSREHFNRKDNTVIYNENNRFCAVDLDKGTTLWKDKREGRSYSELLQVVGDYYYFPFETATGKDGVFVKTLMRGSIRSPNYEHLVNIPIDSIQLWNESYGTFRAPHVYVENGDTKAFLVFDENLDVYQSQSLFSYISYNITDQTYDFEKVRLPDTAVLPVVARPAMIREMMVISAGDFLYGVNKHTGKLVWTRKTFAGSLSDGRFMAAAYKERLFAVNETGSRRLTLELDPFTGATK